MKRFLLLILILSIVSCKTLNYNFSNSVIGEKLSEINSQISLKSIPKKGVIRGIYSQKKVSYKFLFEYDNDNEIYHLVFTTVIDEELIFDAKEMEGSKNYDFFTNNFFTVKIGILINQMKYIFDTQPGSFIMYQTKDDYIVSVSKSRNYFKYDQNYRLIKKENFSKTVRYNYNDKGTDFSRIEYSDNGSHFYLIF